MSLKRNETQLVCIARFIAEEGKATLLLENLHKLITPTLQEGGCIRYELNQSIEDEHLITFVEKFYDQKTFDAHCAKSYITDFFKDGKPDYVKEFDVSLHKEILPIQ